MRQSQNGTHPVSLLAEKLCRLLRLTALLSSDPKEDVVQLRNDLESFIPEVAILDAIVGRILEIYDSQKEENVELSLDVLLEEVREADKELTEQLASVFSSRDHVLVIGERKGGVCEGALKDAAEGFREGDPDGSLCVTIVSILPDHDGVADAMHDRLKGVKGISSKTVYDASIVLALEKCNKVILPAIALDVEDGGLCPQGSTLICAAANRMRIPVVIALPNHRMIPVGCSGVLAMGKQRKSPGKIWSYEEARNDRTHDAITVVSPAYDLVSLQKCQMVVTEFGGYASEYAKFYAPNFDHSEKDSPNQ